MPALLLDMDGVLYHGDRVLPGAIQFVNRIAQYRHCFITNNPSKSPGAVADKLASMGIPRPPGERILTSAQAAARWLASRKPDFSYFAVGAEGLDEALGEFGVTDPDNADFVVIGEGPGIDFDSLTQGVNLVLDGAELISTNPDVTVDTYIGGKHLVVPGGGALVAPFEVATGRRAITIGKPEPLLYQMAMDKLGIDAGDCIMVGDRPDTDIAGAAALGMRTALVRTGRFSSGERWPKAIPRPDWDVESLGDLLAIWDEEKVLDK